MWDPYNVFGKGKNMMRPSVVSGRELDGFSLALCNDSLDGKDEQVKQVVLNRENTSEFNIYNRCLRIILRTIFKIHS